MILRKSEDRGHVNHGWLDTYHTFSFGSYYDPQHMGFRKLRVINEDVIQAEQGFGTHGHRDMEIVSYVVRGELAHKDNMGNASVIRPGEIQRMSAGRGVTHSEFNHHRSEPVHLLQIWIEPDQLGLDPSYEQIDFTGRLQGGRPLLLASPNGEADSVTVHQDVRLFVSRPTAGESVSYMAPNGRYSWLQLVKGTIAIGDQTLTAGDGASFGAGESMEAQAREDAEFLIFDLA